MGHAAVARTTIAMTAFLRLHVREMHRNGAWAERYRNGCIRPNDNIPCSRKRVHATTEKKRKRSCFSDFEKNVKNVNTVSEAT